MLERMPCTYLQDGVDLREVDRRVLARPRGLAHLREDLPGLVQPPLGDAAHAEAVGRVEVVGLVREHCKGRQAGGEGEGR